MAIAKATLERKRNEIGFHEIGRAHGIPIYMLNEKANASQSAKSIVEPKLALPTYQFLLSAQKVHSKTNSMTVEKATTLFGLRASVKTQII